MVNFLNEANKRLANKIENLKTIEEKNTAELAVAFQLFKLATEKGKIAATNDPLYSSMVRNSAYTLNELVIIDVNVVCNYANKFLDLKNFRFENQVDASSNVGELFGIDKILGGSIIKIWNDNFELFKEINDLFIASDIYDHIVAGIENRNSGSSPVELEMPLPPERS